MFTEESILDSKLGSMLTSDSVLEIALASSPKSNAIDGNHDSAENLALESLYNSQKIDLLNAELEVLLLFFSCNFLYT